MSKDGLGSVPVLTMMLRKFGNIPDESCIIWYQLFIYSSHPGDRWVKGVGDDDIVLVFDGNGFIAGVQNVVPVALTDDDKFPFSTSEWYTKGKFFGQDVYYASVYFVDPAIICNGGRTQGEFDAQGTGDRILFQNGPTPDSVYEIPLQQSGMAGNVSTIFVQNSTFVVKFWF